MQDPPIPPASLFRLFRRMGGWIVIVLGVCLLLFTLISHLALQEAKRFEAEGVPARATVSEKYTTISHDGDGNETTSYWFRFAFDTTDGTRITLNETVGSGLYNEVEPGETFDLLYLASRPQRVETEPGSNRSVSRLTQTIAGVLGLIWLAGLWRVGSWAVAAVRARRYGQRETVQVSRVHRTGVRINNRPRYRLVWRDAKGKEGRSLLLRTDQFDGIGPGDRIDIYQGVKTGWWVGDVGERPEG